MHRNTADPIAGHDCLSRAWRRSLLALSLVLGATPGCNRAYFINKEDYVHYNEVTSTNREDRRADEPVLNLPPRTVRNPDSKTQWKLTLAEAKEIALQHNKQIAVLAHQPGETAAAIDLALSAFDTDFGVGGTWGRVDQQVTSAIQVLGTGQNAINQNLFGGPGGYGLNATTGGATQDGLASIPSPNLMSLSKRNAAGGFSSLTYDIEYSRTTPVNQFTAINPAWRSIVGLRVEQPLAQGAGVEHNRAPILIARANHDVTIKQFEETVALTLRDVENAYWQLCFTYQDLYSREIGMSQSLATWQKEKNKLDVGKEAIPRVAQARSQYEFFRAARLEALNRVLIAEGTLRRLMGVAPEDDRQIIPADEPIQAEYLPIWDFAVTETLDQRPELAAQRLNIRSAELNLQRQENGLLPDVSVFANYRITGLDNQLDQSIDRLTDNKFNDWFMGVRYRAPIGERAAHAATRRGRLSLSRERAQLRNLEHNMLNDLREAFQNLVARYDLINAQASRRQAAARQLEAQEQFYLLGASTFDVFLEAQVAFADATRDEAQAVILYNQALAQWEWVRGNMLHNDNIVLSENQASCMTPQQLQRRSRWVNGRPVPIHDCAIIGPTERCPAPHHPLYPLVVEVTEPSPITEPTPLAPPPVSVPPASIPSTMPIPPNKSAQQIPIAPSKIDLPGDIIRTGGPIVRPVTDVVPIPSVLESIEVVP